MKRLIVALLVVFILGIIQVLTAQADPQLVIGKTVATPRTITVCAQSSSTANGQLLRDTLAGITDATGAKPYVIRLEPGRYYLGKAGLAMKEWVTITGSGQNNTWLSASTASALTGVVIAASNCALRNLTVQNANTGVTAAVGVSADSVSGFGLNRVTIFAGGAVGGGGITKGPTNRGLYLDSSSVTVFNSFIQAFTHSIDGGISYAIFNDGSALDLRDSTLKATATGSGRARGIYNVKASPALFHVIIQSKWQGEVEGGAAIGILNTDKSSPGLYDVKITAVADSSHVSVHAVGIDNYSQSSPLVTGSTIIASAEDGSIGVGMRCENGSNPQVHSSVIRAEAYGGSLAYALFTTQDEVDDPPGTVQINSSSLVAAVSGGGARVALLNNTHYTVNIGSTLVDGSVLNDSGSVNCQSCYDGDYDDLNDSCL